VRFNQKAHLITEARYQAWYDLAIQTAGLTDLERAILAAVVAYYQRLAERGYAGLLSYERVADATGWPDVESIKAAVRHLVELGLVAVLPGSGPRANEYLPGATTSVRAMPTARIAEAAGMTSKRRQSARSSPTSSDCTT